MLANSGLECGNCVAPRRPASRRCYTTRAPLWGSAMRAVSCCSRRPCSRPETPSSSARISSPVSVPRCSRLRETPSRRRSSVCSYDDFPEAVGGHSLTPAECARTAACVPNLPRFTRDSTASRTDSRPAPRRARRRRVQLLAPNQAKSRSPPWARRTLTMLSPLWRVVGWPGTSASATSPAPTSAT